MRFKAFLVRSHEAGLAHHGRSLLFPQGTRTAQLERPDTGRHRAGGYQHHIDPAGVHVRNGVDKKIEGFLVQGTVRPRQGGGSHFNDYSTGVLKAVTPGQRGG